MRQKLFISWLVLFGSLLWVDAARAQSLDFRSITLQNGLNGYEGIQKAVIKNAQESRVLIRFNMGEVLPRDIRIVSAMLSIKGPEGVQDAVEGAYLKTEWDGEYSKFGWEKKGVSQDWSSPGAMGPFDIDVEKSFRLNTGEGSAVLDPEVVQSWVDAPENNDGFILHELDQRTTSLEPQLTIYYVNEGNGSGDAGGPVTSSLH